MANRHLSRSIAMQSLFEWDFHNYDIGDLEKVVKKNIDEFAPGIDSEEFVHTLVDEVAQKREKLDSIIEKAAPDWPLEQIAIVDRNVLRLGLYELIFADKKEVPARVAINEAIELAKTFGGEKSGKFVNGVLGAVYREMGEPGKDDIPEKKKRFKDVPYNQMPIEKLGGAVIYFKEDNDFYLAMVHDIFGYWTLSKGHIDAEGDEKEGVIGEIKEELGLDILVKDSLGSNEYIASDPEKGKIRKQVVYFLAESKEKKELELPEDKGGLDKAEWFLMQEISDLKMYDDIVPIVANAIKILAGAKKEK